MQQFNSLPSAVKKLIADAYGFNLGIDQATGKLVAYNSLDPNTKNQVLTLRRLSMLSVLGLTRFFSITGKIRMKSIYWAMLQE